MWRLLLILLMWIVETERSVVKNSIWKLHILISFPFCQLFCKQILRRRTANTINAYSWYSFFICSQNAWSSLAKDSNQDGANINTSVPVTCCWSTNDSAYILKYRWLCYKSYSSWRTAFRNAFSYVVPSMSSLMILEWCYKILPKILSWILSWVQTIQAPVGNW